MLLLAAAAVCMAASQSESSSEEDIFEESHFRRSVGVPAAARREPAASCFLYSDASDDDGCAPRRATSMDDMNSTSRGKYSRTSATKKQPHADQAAAYRQVIESSSLRNVCNSDCTFDCSNCLTRNEMYKCLENSYGTIEWISDETLKVRRPAACKLFCTV
jgi:hypothetical protein